LETHSQGATQQQSMLSLLMENQKSLFSRMAGEGAEAIAGPEGLPAGEQEMYPTQSVQRLHREDQQSLDWAALAGGRAVGMQPMIYSS